MRKLSLVALVAGFCLCFTSVANATSVNLSFEHATVVGGGISGLGTDEVTLGVGATATLTMDIQMTADSRGVSNAVFSIKFDTDLVNELNVLSLQELSWMNMKGTRNLDPVNPGILSSQESFTSTQEGQAYSFEGVTLGNGPQNTTLTFARIVFKTTANVATDGADVFAYGFNTGVDGFFTNGGQDIESEVFPTTTSVTATVNIIPEPGTFALLGLGIGALVVAGRRRSRS